MRVNVYAEEMTDRIQIISKEIEGRKFTGLRFYLELPVTLNAHEVEQAGAQPDNRAAPFYHHHGDDDSSAVTFWGKRDLREVLRKALEMLDQHYAARS
jgi:hypothetical protein